MGTVLQYTTLGVLLGHVNLDAREEGGENKGAFIKRYLKSCDPPITDSAPWCAAVIQYASDIAAKGLSILNPLNAVEFEALVQSYVNWGTEEKKLVPYYQAAPGDLVCFSFGGVRYDHIGMVQAIPDRLGAFVTVEGNTSDALVKDKFRSIHTGHKPVIFIRWAI